MIEIKAPKDLNRIELFCRCGGEVTSMDSMGTPLCSNCTNFRRAKLKVIFLAGSIEMGMAENWQDGVRENLKNIDVLILNPRRDDWDSSWIQSKKNKQFREQVEWELNALEKADKIIMYFDPTTKSPISLLELGLFKDKKIMVCCPNGFWRKGNVDIVCDRYNIPLFEDINKLIIYLKKQL